MKVSNKEKKNEEPPELNETQEKQKQDVEEPVKPIKTEPIEPPKPKSKPVLYDKPKEKIIKANIDESHKYDKDWEIESSESEREEVEYIDLQYIEENDIDSYIIPGTVSPILLREKDIQDNIITDPYEDIRKLQDERRIVLEKQNRVDAGINEKKYTEDEIEELSKEQGDQKIQEETVFDSNQEIVLPPQVYSWQDKYKPRKPTYHNRVKMGFEWNRFNQAHYDEDNPPPKVVFGYKFNVFYPDLVNPSVAPSYKIIKGDSPEFCIIRFMAGAPYEDIAFKVLLNYISIDY